MAEIEEALENCLELFRTGPVSGLATAATTQAEPPVGQSGEPIRVTPLPATPAPAGPARSRRVVYLGAVAGLAVAAVAVGALSARSHEKSPAQRPAPGPAPAQAAATTTMLVPRNEPPPPPDAPVMVPLTVHANVATATLSFRRRVHPAGKPLEMSSGNVAELLEISAAGRKTARYWITLDRATRLRVTLRSGRGTVEATESETLVALGEASDQGPTDASMGPNAEAPLRSNRAERRRVGKATAPAAQVAMPTGSASDRGSPVNPGGGSNAGSTAIAGNEVGSPTGVSPRTTAITPTGGTGGTGAGGSAATSSNVTAGTTNGSAAPSVAEPSIDTAAVKSAVRVHIAEVASCYERGRMDNNELAGRVVIRIAIGTDGRAVSTAVQSSTLHTPKVESCIASAAKTWRYPSAIGGTAVVTYPFVLK